MLVEAPAFAATGSPLDHFSAPLSERRQFAEQVRDTVLATVSVTVKNTGKTEGDEVVFLFKNATAVVKQNTRFV